MPSSTTMKRMPRVLAFPVNARNARRGIEAILERRPRPGTILQVRGSLLCVADDPGCWRDRQALNQAEGVEETAHPPRSPNRPGIRGVAPASGHGGG